MNKCNFCDNSMLVPNSIIPKIIDKYIMLYNKNKKKLFLNKVIIFSKMSKEAEKYVKNKYNEIYCDKIKEQSEIMYDEASYYVRMGYLDSQRSTKEINHLYCDYCKFNSCEFHIINGNFLFYYCKNCKINIGICGWCREYYKDFKKQCYKCFSNKSYEYCKQKYFVNIINENIYFGESEFTDLDIELDEFK